MYLHKVVRVASCSGVRDYLQVAHDCCIVAAKILSPCQDGLAIFDFEKSRASIAVAFLVSSDPLFRIQWSNRAIFALGPFATSVCFQSRCIPVDAAQARAIVDRALLLSESAASQIT